MITALLVIEAVLAVVGALALVVLADKVLTIRRTMKQLKAGGDHQADIFAGALKAAGASSAAPTPAAATPTHQFTGTYAAPTADDLKK